MNHKETLQRNLTNPKLLDKVTSKKKLHHKVKYKAIKYIPNIERTLPNDN